MKQIKYYLILRDMPQRHVIFEIGHPKKEDISNMGLKHLLSRTREHQYKRVFHLWDVVISLLIIT